MHFTIVDGAVVVIALVSGLLAWSRGLTRELFAILGWIVAAIAAFAFAPMLQPMLKELPYVGHFLAGSCVLATIAAFVIVVAAALLVLSVFTPLLSNAILDSPLAGVDRALGFVFGVIRGLALVAVAWALYQNLSAATWPPVEKAWSNAIFTDLAVKVRDALPTETPAWFGARVDGLMAPCGGELPPVVPKPEPAPAPTQKS